MKFFIVFAICMIVYCNCSRLVDYRLSARSVFNDGDDNGGTVTTTTTAAPPTFKCEQAGLQCKDCNTVVNCLDMGGIFMEITTNVCTGDKSCNKGACSTEATNQCSGLAAVGFKCNAIGMFPNPADCQKFYICVEEPIGTYKTFAGKCSKDRAYDMTRTYCNLKMDANNQCPASTIVPTCDKPGSTFVLTNKSIFGMCVIDTEVPNNPVLVPRLYLCPNGTQYTPTTYKCA